MVNKLTFRLQAWRHFVQVLAFIFLNGKIFGLASTALIVPYLHATQAPFSTVLGAYEALEWTIAHGIFPLLVLGVIYLTAITVGRVFCGWACPFGMIQDFLSYLPFKQRRLSVGTSNSLRDIKWALLLFSLVTVFFVGIRRSANDLSFGVFTDSPFSVLSPSATLFSYIPWMMIWRSNILASAGYISWLKFAILFGSLIPSLYIPRFFCRYACPMGGLLEPFSGYKILRLHRSVKFTREKINETLGEICPMGVTMEENSDFIDHPGCIHCGKCITEMPHQLEQRHFD